MGRPYGSHRRQFLRHHNQGWQRLWHGVKITPDGTTTTLHSFRGGLMDGATPYGALIQVADGTFYGTTGAGGAFGLGTIFRMTTDGTVAVVHAFSGTEVA